MKAILSEKGQVTIPKALRERLGLETGQVLDFREHNGCLIASKISLQDPVSAVYGTLRLGRRTDDAIKELRGEADRP